MHIKCLVVVAEEFLALITEKWFSEYIYDDIMPVAMPQSLNKMKSTHHGRKTQSYRIVVVEALFFKVDFLVAIVFVHP